MAINELEARLLKRIRELEAKVDFLGRAFNNLSSRMASKSQVKGIFDTIILPLDHGKDLIGQEDDDHAGYPWMLGRAGSQSINGGVAASEDLTLDSTAHATKGDVIIQPSGGNVGIGTSSPDSQLHVEHITGAVQRMTRKDDAVGTDDIVGRIEFETQDSGSPGIAAYIQGIAEGTSGEVGLSLATGVGGLAVERLRITNTGIFDIASLPVYANNAAAITGGLTAGNLYRTNGDPDTVCIVH